MTQTCQGCGKRRRTRPGTPIVCDCYVPGTAAYGKRTGLQLTKSQAKRVRAQKGLDPVPEVRFRLIQDEDCHWYVIRTDQVEQFHLWVQAMTDGDPWVGNDFNECRVNGPHSVSFREWSES